MAPSNEIPVEAKEAATQLLDQGYLVLKNVIAAENCDTLLRHVLTASDEGRRLGRKDLFGNIQESDQRADLKLDLCVPVIEALNQVGERCGPIWNCIMGDRVRVVELASITSDPGAVAQPVHADTMHGVTRFLQSDISMPVPSADEFRDDDAADDLTSVVRAIATDTALIYTCLVALQDVDSDMGPTHVWPGTNTVEHHATLWATGGAGDNADKLLVADADKAFGVTHRDMTLSKGDLVMYDSRTMHCGGANTSQKRRSVFVVSTMGPGIRPDGTTWSMLKSLRNRLLISDLPLSLDKARSPAADPDAGEIILPPAPEAAAEGYSKADDEAPGKPVPPLQDWDAAVQCTLCSRWRPCTAAEAPKFTGTERGFTCPMAGFSCLQEQGYSTKEIDAMF